MVSRSKKTVCVYTMMIMASVWSDATAKIAKRAAIPFQSQVPYTGGIVSPASKGYFNPQMSGGLGYYNNQPVNAAYWTGHAGHYPQPYPNYQYQQYNQQYYPQQYGYGHPMSGYSESYGNYPNFDPTYWSMSSQANYPYQGQQYYPGQAYYHQGGHAYYPGQGYYPEQNMYNNGYYTPGGQYMYQPQPWYKKPFGAGFMGGQGHKLVKGLVGAALVGVIAGKVARG